MWYCKNCKGKERLLEVARSMNLHGVAVGGAFSFLEVWWERTIIFSVRLDVD